MTPGSREGGRKCHTTHRCNTQTGRITDITLGSAQPSTPAVGECNPRRAIKQDTLFYQQLKQDSVIHSPRYLSSFSKKKKTINIVVSPIRRLYSFHILNRPAKLLKADQITKHYLPGATSPAGCTEPLSSDTYVWKLKCKMFSNCLDFLLQKILDYYKRNCVPSKCKLLEVRM